MFPAAEGRPIPGQASPMDAPDDFFRIRLVCVLLDAVGMCFDRGSLKRKLDDYIVFFQVLQQHFASPLYLLTYDKYYVLCKGEPPLDIAFMLSDTIEVRHFIYMYLSFKLSQFRL